MSLRPKGASSITLKERMMNIPSAVESVIDLPPPLIKENPDNTNLNPVAVKDTLTVIVDYVMEPDDESA